MNTVNRYWRSCRNKEPDRLSQHKLCSVVPPIRRRQIMFKKILVPLDGSDLAAKILPQVETLAKQINAQVTLLTVGSSNICASGEGAAKGAGAAAPCPELPLANYLEQDHRQAPGRRHGGAIGSINRDIRRRRSWPMRTRTRWTSSPWPPMAAASLPGSWGAWPNKVLAHATVCRVVVRVTEPKPPTLKSEMFYSMQTP